MKAKKRSILFLFLTLIFGQQDIFFAGDSKRPQTVSRQEVQKSTSGLEAREKIFFMFDRYLGDKRYGIPKKKFVAFNRLIELLSDNELRFLVNLSDGVFGTSNLISCLRTTLSNLSDERRNELKSSFLRAIDCLQKSHSIKERLKKTNNWITGFGILGVIGVATAAMYFTFVNYGKKFLNTYQGLGEEVTETAKATSRVVKCLDRGITHVTAEAKPGEKNIARTLVDTVENLHDASDRINKTLELNENGENVVIKKTIVDPVRQDLNRGTEKVVETIQCAVRTAKNLAVGKESSEKAKLFMQYINASDPERENMDLSDSDKKMIINMQQRLENGWFDDQEIKLCSMDNSKFAAYIELQKKEYAKKYYSNALKELKREQNDRFSEMKNWEERERQNLFNKFEKEKKNQNTAEQAAQYIFNGADLRGASSEVQDAVNSYNSWNPLRSAWNNSRNSAIKASIKRLEREKKEKDAEKVSASASTALSGLSSSSSSKSTTVELTPAVSADSSSSSTSGQQPPIEPSGVQLQKPNNIPPAKPEDSSFNSTDAQPATSTEKKGGGWGFVSGACNGMRSVTARAAQAVSVTARAAQAVVDTVWVKRQEPKD